MHKIFIVLLSLIGVTFASAAKDPRPFLETRFHNPVDTLQLLHGEGKSIILFVHENIHNCKTCPTKKWQRALMSDTLNILRDNNIQLYIVYDNFYVQDFDECDSYNKSDGIIIVDLNQHFRKSFPDTSDVTPYIVGINNGCRSYILGGGLDDLYKYLETTFNLDIVCHKCNGTGEIKICHRCHGTGQVTPRRNGSHDESVGICPLCGGSGKLSQQCNNCHGLGITRKSSL